MDENTIYNDVTIAPGIVSKTVIAGRYRVVRKLGEGGMGTVWLAEDTKLDDRQVAIKMLPSILVNNKRAYQQVKKEALVTLKLSHPNIATVRAFEEDNGNPFLVMDYIDGQTLDDYLAENGTLTEDETIKLLKPVAAALDYAHTQGVVHRDVKPGNVIISKDGVPFVLDFGIAREVQETMTRVTGKLSSGTLMYMSPEQLNGEEPTAAQDVYSFAAMAYECLKGKPPFVRGCIEDQIKHKQPPPLDSSIAINGSVMAGLAKTSDERPKSCAEVLAGADGSSCGTVDSFKREPTAEETADTAEDQEYKQIQEEIKRVEAILAQKEEVALKAEERARALQEAKRKLEKLREQVGDDGSGHKAGDVRVIDLPGGAKMEMMWCPAGSFMMGSPESEEGRFSDETQHKVTLTEGFWMGKYEVTQAQWESVMGSNPSRFKGEDYPVEQVSWDDCQEFIRKINVGGKVNVSLPTEAQWEYACRAGTTGEYAGDLDSIAWYRDNSGHETHPVGRKRPNAWGLYDMHGNVWEWCADWKGDYPTGAVADPTGPASGTDRVVRGGSWYGNAQGCRSANRYWGESGLRNISLGLRLACSQS